MKSLRDFLQILPCTVFIHFHSSHPTIPSKNVDFRRGSNHSQRAGSALLGLDQVFLLSSCEVSCEFLYNSVYSGQVSSVLNEVHEDVVPFGY